MFYYLINFLQMLFFIAANAPGIAVRLFLTGIGEGKVVKKLQPINYLIFRKVGCNFLTYRQSDSILPPILFLSARQKQMEAIYCVMRSLHFPYGKGNDRNLEKIKAKMINRRC